MLVGVEDVDDEAAYGPALEAHGFAIRVRQPGHRMYRTPDQDVHVHVFTDGSEAARIRLLFRDWLRHDAADRRLYEDTKRALARQEWEATNDYSDAKGAVVARDPHPRAPLGRRRRLTRPAFRPRPSGRSDGPNPNLRSSPR